MSATAKNLAEQVLETSAKPAAGRWPKAIMAIHWATAVLLIVMVVVGGTMGDLDPESPARRWFSRLHTVGGITLVLLTALRLWVRRKGPRPASLGLAPLHQLGVGVIHGLLYVVVFGLGLSGLATARSSGHWHEYLFGSAAGAPDTSGLAHGVHETLVGALIVLVALHVGGAIVDQIRRGGTLRRMIPFLR